ncbi:MAG: hypothetical protein AAFU79_25615 [Myxococcota bacterium]
MGLFDGIKRLLQTQTRETQRERQGEAIRAFWAYWRDAEAELFALMGEDVPEKVVEQVSDAVHAIQSGEREATRDVVFKLASDLEATRAALRRVKT